MQNHYSTKTMRHGMCLMVIGLLAGFLLIFSMLGGASLNPIPAFISFEMPGTEKGWRIVHVGALMNGIMALVIGCAMRFFYLSDVKARWVSLGTILAIWGNLSFYIFGMFAPNHGLTLQDNRLGEANWAAVLAFAPALLGAVTLIVALLIVIRSEAIDG
ncbi:MAG: hypothetical protein ACPHCJ_05495 [Oceanococcaceae bacterium]